MLPPPPRVKHAERRAEVEHKRIERELPVSQRGRSLARCQGTDHRRDRAVRTRWSGPAINQAAGWRLSAAGLTSRRGRHPT